jgi:hypothetical protein
MSPIQASYLMLVTLAGAPVEIEAPQSLDKAERVAELVEQTGRDLVQLLTSETAESIHRHQAIKAIGRLKPDAAIRPLLDNLLFKGEWVTEPGSLCHYPAAETLVGYGSAIYPRLWAKLLGKCSDDYLYVVAFTLHAIDGKEIAIIRVKEQLRHPKTTPTQVKNCSELLRQLEATRFDDPHSWPRRSSPIPPVREDTAPPLN